MSEDVVNKLKKYILYISVLFFLVLGWHLTFVYLYDGAESEAIEWGTVSEAIIWSFPHFNPLLPSNDHNEYINALLYRSMLQYSANSWSFESDLVSCNLDNLLYIECVLEPNLLWSDWSNITSEDIAGTLNIIRETRVNPIIASLLDDTTIETSSDSISFSRTSKDINFLKVFFQPIIPASITENLNSNNVDGKFSEINGIYSGRFRLINISQDETVGITKLTLWKNDTYHNNEMFLNFLILNLFRDESHFLKNKNSFNIFNDTDAIIGWSIPRLESYEYTLSQFAWVFMNSENLNLSFRSYLWNLMDRESIITALWTNKVTPAYNPFLSDTNIDTFPQWFSLSKTLSDLWYYSKKDLLKTAIANQQEIEEKIVSQEATVTKIIPEKTQQQLEYIISPSTQKYNFVSEDNILIEWKVDPEIESVYINDYKLSGFAPWDTSFFYRLLEGYDSIVEWENVYKIYFWKGKEKKFIEEFVYVYNTDTEKLEEIENDYFTQEAKQEELAYNEAEEVEEKEEETIWSDIQLETDLEVLENLNDSYYYNSKWERYTLTMIYTKEDPEISLVANTISSQLEKVWIFLELKALTLWDITTGLRSEELEYDMMLIWINLGFLGSDIFPYFHSGQVQNGYNISNYKKLSLDILLEELKSNNLSNTKKQELEEKMLEILGQESIVKVLYTPKIQLLVDQNIKNFEFPAYLPDSKFRYTPLIESYLSEKKIIASGEKTISWFLKFLFSKISS